MWPRRAQITITLGFMMLLIAKYHYQLIKIPRGDQYALDFLRNARALVDIPNDVNYGSHQVPLLAAVYVTEGAVLEMGCGHFSTPLLHNITAQRNRFLLTADTDQTWLGKLKHLETDKHPFKWISSLNNYSEWDDSGDYRAHWGLAFLDHKPGERRRIDLHRLKDRADLLVIHDTEGRGYGHGPGYGYDFSEFRYVFQEKLHVKGVATTVASNSRADLMEKTVQLLKLARAEGIK